AGGGVRRLRHETGRDRADSRKDRSDNGAGGGLMMSGTVPMATAGQEDVRRFRHDLRTPLNHVIGYGELLLEEAEEGENDELLTLLRGLIRAGKEAVALIERHLTPRLTSPDGVLGGLQDGMRAPLTTIDVKITEIRALNEAVPASDLDKIEA